MLAFRANTMFDRRMFLALGMPLLSGIAKGNTGDGSKTRKAKSVLVVFCGGGQSQLEMWDPKPNAPVEIRGAFGSIATKVPGLRFGEHLPKVANVANKFTVLKSVSHDDLDHGSACYLSLTGHFHPQKSANPPPRPDDLPTVGSIFRRIRPMGPFGFSSSHVNGPLLVPELNSPGQNSGYLGRAYDPLAVDGSNPEKSLPSLNPREELPTVRIQQRQSLKNALEKEQRKWESVPGLLDHDLRYKQAYQILSDPKARSAFDLSQEKDSVRDRYGRNRSGQACLLARRLVEREMPWITVFWNPNIRGQDSAPNETDQYGWDTHNDIFESMKDHLLPRFDQSFSALLEDMDSRGLLDSTLVVCMGEFGRAPLVALEPRFAGATPGRKHWAATYSVVFAGAGVTQGGVVGATDRAAAYPIQDRVTPQDIITTLFDALGVPPTEHYHDLLNRPVAVSTGKPIKKLFI